MGRIRISSENYSRVWQHLFGSPGEHFAFMRGKWSMSMGQPVLWITAVDEVPDEATTSDSDGHEVDTEALLATVNTAARSGEALVEVHNHALDPPRWSMTDRRGLTETVPYMLESLPGRPYLSTVWTETQVYGECFMAERREPLTGFCVIGDSIQQLILAESEPQSDLLFSRQEPWFTTQGQRRLGNLRIGIVGLGGTGSPLIQ